MEIQVNSTRGIVSPLENIIKINGIYQHYKGNKYRVIMLVWQCELDIPERWVVYQGLYIDERFGSKPVFTRALDKFLDKVVIGGALVDRFGYCWQAEEL